jgi:mRNA-degrading endonuclease YafQ of YafQ-DinJ toxin-antitoxin module
MLWCMVMATSIQISKDLQRELIKRKMFDKESYEEIIWDLIEDSLELNEETKKDLAKARAEYKAGKYQTLAQVKKELGL